MAICRFYQEGRCRYGDRCKYEHPTANSIPQNQNRFAVFQTPGSNSSRDTSNGHFGGTAGTSLKSYSLSTEIIRTDLTRERPQWILSAYGPGRDAPLQLFGDYPLEQSFEEMRLYHYMAVASGNEQHAVQRAEAFAQDARKLHQNALSDLGGAIKFITDGVNSHPNRLDICAGPNGANTNNAKPHNPFTQTNVGFGKPSIVNETTSTFGRPSGSFGQPTSNQHLSSGFGQTSQSNTQPINSLSLATSFGRPSQIGTNSGFGQSAQQAGGFGQPAQLGQKPNPFSQPSQPSSGGAFGQPSQLSAMGKVNLFAQHTSAASGGKQPTTMIGGFGQPSQPVASSTFAQPAQPVPVNPFSQPTQASNTGAFGSAPNQPSQSSQPNSFLSSSPQSAPPTAAGGSAPAVNKYGTAGVDLGHWPKDATNNPVPFPLQVPGPSDTSSRLSHPDIRTYSVRDPKNKLLVWKGRPVSYIENLPYYKRADDNEWERIWFPDGPQPQNKEPELPMDDYDEATREAYQFMQETGTFKDGKMPMLPPRREWCSWDL